jgi:DNA repair protein SbcD/Mre11
MSTDIPITRAGDPDGLVRGRGFNEGSPMTKFVHCADLHIDSPLKGLAAYPGAPVQAIRGATRQAVESLIDLCLEEAVSVVVIAGDVFDGDWKDFSTGLYLRAQLARLHEASIEVVLIRGNHDAASVITRKLKLPNVHVLPHDRPGSVLLEHAGLAIHGQSFATRAVSENLAAGYPAPVDGFTNVGVLHTCLTGYAEHERYAPCELEQLVAHGYEYWALGHVHERAVLHEHPFVVFPGNLQGRHMRECGAKGATVVEIGDHGLSIRHHTLDHVRWTRVRVDAGGAVDELEVLERANAALRSALETCDGRLMAARIELTGVTTAHASLVRERERLDAELRGLATDVGSEQIWLERVDWDIAPPRSAVNVEQSLGAALGVLRRAGDDPSTLAALAEQLRPLALKLPTELKTGPEGIDPTDPDTIRRLLADAQDLLPSYLLERAA